MASTTRWHIVLFIFSLATHISEFLVLFLSTFSDYPFVLLTRERLRFFFFFFFFSFVFSIEKHQLRQIAIPPGSTHTSIDKKFLVSGLDFFFLFQRNWDKL